jgi:uncharacterized protein YjlB
MKSVDDLTATIQQINIIRHFLSDDGRFPNNARLPLLVLQNALLTSDGNAVEEIFESNGWVNAWQNGIYDFHHYHSKAHEVLGVIKGTARVQFGGPNGVAVSMNPGDVVIIPAGVAHKFIEGEDDFTVVGAYPEGQLYDVMYGKDGERPAADENIRALSLPASDPVYGTDGPLIKSWL